MGVLSIFKNVKKEQKEKSLSDLVNTLEKNNLLRTEKELFELLK